MRRWHSAEWYFTPRQGWNPKNRWLKDKKHCWDVLFQQYTWTNFGPSTASFIKREVSTSLFKGMFCLPTEHLNNSTWKCSKNGAKWEKHLEAKFSTNGNAIVKLIFQIASSINVPDCVQWQVVYGSKGHSCETGVLNAIMCNTDEILALKKCILHDLLSWDSKASGSYEFIYIFIFWLTGCFNGKIKIQQAGRNPELRVAFCVFFFFFFFFNLISREQSRQHQSFHSLFQISQNHSNT